MLKIDCKSRANLIIYIAEKKKSQQIKHFFKILQVVGMKYFERNLVIHQKSFSIIERRMLAVS